MTTMHQKLCLLANRLNDRVGNNCSIWANTGISPISSEPFNPSTTWADVRWTDEKTAKRIIKYFIKRRMK